MLLCTVMQVAVKGGCQRLAFVVLRWNELALKFYRKLNAVDKTETEHWHLFHVTDEDLQQLAVLGRPGYNTVRTL